jgi:heme-degrading monooxygenase HmoA
MNPGSYVVIFVSKRTDSDPEGYESMAQRMVDLASAQPGFLGMETARGSDGMGVTVCYWKSEDAIAAWKRDVDHAAAQTSGRQAWYSLYKVTIARVERSYEHQP